MEERCPCCNTALAGAPRLEGRDRLHGGPGSCEVAVCPTCGAGTTLPRLPTYALGGMYPTDYSAYHLPASRFGSALSAAIRGWQAFRAFRSAPLRELRVPAPGRAVDVGCGRGDLGAALADRGWRVTGVEPSADACGVAARRGIDARCGTLDSVTLEPGGYDAAIFNHSLEHVADPVLDLGRISRALRPGGLVLVTVPHFGGWQARRFRDRWYHLDLPRHRVHFTRDGLRRALERAGLEVAELSTSSSSAGLAASVQYAIAGRCLFAAGLPLRVASAAASVTWPLAVLADRAAGDGDLLHAVARRSA